MVHFSQSVFLFLARLMMRCEREKSGLDSINGGRVDNILVQISR